MSSFGIRGPSGSEKSSISQPSLDTTFQGLDSASSSAHVPVLLMVSLKHILAWHTVFAVPCKCMFFMALVGGPDDMSENRLRDPPLQDC